MLNDIQRQKIQYFNSIVNNRNENLAISYLNQVNWNEAKAVELYYENASLSNSISQNLSQPPNPPNNYRYAKAMKECHFYNDNNQGLFSQVFSYIKTTLGFKNNNSELCANLNGIVNGLVKGSNEFILKLKDKKGIIILYSPETYQKLIDNILLINQEYTFDTIFYPIINNSDEGENLIQQLKIYNFPCYLFCKYKNERIFYVTDIIQQNLNINQFKNCLSQLDQIGNNINNANNINQPRYNADNNWQYYNQFNDNRINANNSNNYGYLYNSRIQPNSQNYPYNININNNNLQNYPKSEIILNPSQNDSNSNNINKKKEYIPDYRDYDLDGSLSFSYLNQSNNNSYNYGLDKSNSNNNNINNSNNNFSNNYNINNSHNSFNNNLNNSNNNLNNNNNNNINISDSLENVPITDSFIRRKQDDEMKRLEEMEEEKERKEKEEQEKKRIEEGKEKEKLKFEKEEKELFSQIIPPEPDDSNPDKCVIIFRLPDGQKNIQRKFLKTNKISLLYDYIKSLGREIYTEDQYNNFSIIQTFPFKNFEDKLNNTLEEEGLYPNSVLQIKENN